MSMTWVKIGKKFPWWAIPLIIVIVVLVFVVMGLLLPEVGAWLVNGLAFIFFSLLDIAVACFTSIFFWGGFITMAIPFCIYFYRKNYAKTKVLTPTIPSTQGYDSLSKPLFDDDTKVEQA
jgi:hypothetical protein